MNFHLDFEDLNTSMFATFLSTSHPAPRNPILMIGTQVGK
jgi:hypothetical protein